jgi:hypothetical protein
VTALDTFERLECEGVYAPGGGAGSQPVVVQFGNASLTITTFDDLPLAHWPLASLDCAPLDNGRLRVTPDAASDDALLIDDPTMQQALKAVIAQERPRGRRPRRLLRAAVAVACAAIAAAGLWVAIDPYRSMAAQVPRGAATQLGLAAVTRHAAGRLCTRPAGQRALDRLAAQLVAGEGGTALVLRVVRGSGDLATTVGGVVVIPVSILQQVDGPADLAALLLSVHRDDDDEARLAGLMQTAGPASLLAVMRGDLTEPRLVSAAVAALATASSKPEPIAEGLDQPRIAGVAWSSIRAICD